jgi:hypothetical protein
MINGKWKDTALRYFPGDPLPPSYVLLTSDWSAFTLSSIEKREDIHEKSMNKKKRAELLQGMLDLLILRALRHGPLNGRRFAA